MRISRPSAASRNRDSGDFISRTVSIVPDDSDLYLIQRCPRRRTTLINKKEEENIRRLSEKRNCSRENETVTLDLAKLASNEYQVE